MHYFTLLFFLFLFIFLSFFVTSGFGIIFLFFLFFILFFYIPEPEKVVIENKKPRKRKIILVGGR